MRYALFQKPGSDYQTIWDEEFRAAELGYVQMTEWVEVHFPPLKSEAVIQAQLRALSLARQEVVEKFTKALKDIDERRNSLMALTHEVAA